MMICQHRYRLTNLVVTLLFVSFSVLAPPPSFVSGLPFRTRGKSSKSDEESEHSAGVDVTVTAEAIDVNGDISEIKIPSRSESRRNTIVERFFDDQMATTGNDTTSYDLLEDISIRSNELSEFLTSTRRVLHKRPELMYKEKETSAYVQHVLNELEISYSTGWAINTVPQNLIEGPGGYGIVADIGTGGQPCVLLRADMDALPIYERTEHIDEFKSQNDGKMQ